MWITITILPTKNVNSYQSLEDYNENTDIEVNIWRSGTGIFEVSETFTLIFYHFVATNIR